MKETQKGTVTVYRYVTPAPELIPHVMIDIRAEGDPYGDIIASAKLSLEAFARLLTGVSYTPCEVITYKKPDSPV